MKIRKVSPLLIFMVILVFLGLVSSMGFAQGLSGLWGLPWVGNPFYSPFALFGGAFFPQGNIFPQLYGRGFGWGVPFGPTTLPTPTLLSPYQRRPNATIIFTSPTLTAVGGAAPGVILIGATGVLGAPTVVVPPPTVVAPTVIAAPLGSTALALTNPAPAPLFSLLAVLYASALLDGKALLSTANPLLFAYLQTLVF
ncbi:MAG: hypothetical protein ACMUIM_05455 [bacterium]